MIKQKLQNTDWKNITETMHQNGFTAVYGNP